MNSSLSQQLQNADAKKATFITQLESLSDSDKSKVFKQGEWSPTQVLHHLVHYELYIMGGRQKAIEGGDTLKPKWTGKIFLKIIQIMISRKLRFGTIKQFEPPQDVDLEASLKDWQKVREEIMQAVKDQANQDSKKIFTVHPMAGPITLAETIELFALHLDYHIRYFPKP